MDRLFLNANVLFAARAAPQETCGYPVRDHAGRNDHRWLLHAVAIRGATGRNPNGGCATVPSSLLIRSLILSSSSLAGPLCSACCSSRRAFGLSPFWAYAMPRWKRYVELSGFWFTSAWKTSMALSLMFFFK